MLINFDTVLIDDAKIRFRLLKSKFQNYKKRGFTAGIWNGYSYDFRQCNACWHSLIMTYRGCGGVVESGCKPIYNDQNQYFLDFTVTNYDICTFTRVVVTSTNLQFGSTCDILIYRNLTSSNSTQSITSFPIPVQ